eukprot:CAMPEP_0172547230 /NCGR_PEP_ID=MMETSP1067-20121228/16806_1 /TAXON_ID=265564 ORGANISM="Thalassiosira punctigera, Strain Tpunct2005C2" /NCGR_SAMPLE_ID=MMETSP1067 /ASSEMBLY_ACC=CAM_ASM_000444 /LENGTH=763 /DNA_ID=CAMNT_0013334287 /DNA_START=201 /DNA_END=2492 /DNA_ORIENTATION=-
MEAVVNHLVIAVAIGALFYLPPNASHALSSTNFESIPRASSPRHRRRGLSPCKRCNELSYDTLFPRQRHIPLLWAVAENAVATEIRSEAEDDTDIPMPTDASPGLTVVAGHGTRITSVSGSVAAEQDFWETKFDQGEFVRTAPPPGHKKVVIADSSHPRKEERVIVDYQAVDQDFWETKFDQGEFVRSFPSRKNTKVGGFSTDYPGKHEKVIAEYDLFPDDIFGRGDKDFIPENVNNESENNILEDTDSNADEVDETERLERTSGGEGDESDESAGDSAIRSTLAKSAIMRRAGIAGTVRKSSKSSGRSSRAKTHVSKSRSGSNRIQVVGAMGRVLDTVRTAAAAAAAKERKKSLENTRENDMVKDNSTRNSLKAETPVSSKWESAIQSVVADMLQSQDAVVRQQSLGTAMSHCESTTNSPPPPGTASMGLLGDVVEQRLPVIPPIPGKLLVSTDEDITPTPKRHVSIRSSIPHSSDDIHIANLRLSVFSRFDEEQQRIFRSRSLEVLNIRRRRGAVVLVAEAAVPGEAGRESQHQHLTDMQARIADGHEYVNINCCPAAADSHKSHSPSLAVTPIRGTKITSVSSAVATGSPSLTVTPIRGTRISSVSSGVVVSDHCNQTPQTTVNGTNSRGCIIGSVECSHQEFRGTMLGNSRPKGALMYVTEVAVRTDARRCGAGAMLMRGVDEIASLRNVETIYLHVDVANRAACTMYEKCGYHYLDKREPIYAQFTASLNLHDGAMHGRKHYLMCKNRADKTMRLAEE